MSRSRIITLLTIILATAIGFGLWLLFLIVLWSLLRVAGISTDFWAMTEALSTAVAAAAVLGAGYVAYRELNELDDSRHMQIADRLFEELNSRDSIEARRWIFQQLPDDPQEGIGSLTPEGQQNVKTVLNSLDRVAFLTQSGWIPDELIMPWMNPMIVKSCVKLEPYLGYERRRRKEPDYYEYVSQLGLRCQSWRSKNLPSAEITWLDDAL
jgi:hypothetical protein